MKYLFLLGCSFAVAAPAWANEDVVYSVANRIGDEEITVLASGLRQPVDSTGQAISVVAADELASIQGPDITRVLERLPGVTLTRNGGLGAFTGVRVRGASSEQTLVLVDGARVADVSSPGSGFDFGTLLSGNIAKVELLRGSNSVIWGSDAIGGVVAVTTKATEGLDASAEYGAYDSFTGAASGGIKAGALTLSVNGGYARSDGFSALAADAEADGFEQWQVGGRAAVDLGGGLNAFVDARYARSDTDIDFSFANDYVQTMKQASGRAGVTYASDAIDLAASYSLADTNRAYASPFFGYAYDGRNQTAELRGRWKAAGAFSVLFGAGHTWDRYEGTFDTRQTSRQASGHLLADYSTDTVTFAAGARLDHHSRFGDAWSMGANGSVKIGGEWRVRASYGEGFKAPTLYQLFGFAGNLALEPERSRSYEAGIEKGDRASRLHFAATVFRRDSRNLIDYDANANCGWGGYLNVSGARASGFELEADVRPVETLQLRAAYSYVKSVNRTTGRDLYRRPRHALSLSGDWTTPLHGLVIGADTRFVGPSMDDQFGDSDPTNDVRLQGHVVLTLRASLPVTEQFDLFGRIENVGNADYQTVAGYNTPGRSAYIGARARF
ncbi:MAG: TonB-dependent receptor plug domain-containing protein [Novosphingobium sp.]